MQNFEPFKNDLQIKLICSWKSYWKKLTLIQTKFRLRPKIHLKALKILFEDQ